MRPNRLICIADVFSRCPRCLHIPVTRVQRPPTSYLKSDLFSPSLQVRTLRDGAFPSPERFEPKATRFSRYQDDHHLDIHELRNRNPLDYVSANRIRLRRNEYHRKRMYFAGLGLAICLTLQAFLILSFYEDGGTVATENDRSRMKQGGRERDRMDATPAQQAFLQGKEVVVHHIPGTEKIVDDDGKELVETGTSTIPHFPRIIELPMHGFTAGGATMPKNEEYTLIGLGVRKVSFLSIQVYVVGLYARTADMSALQASFVRHVNPLASALIPGEKDVLKKELLEAEKSLEVWDHLLRDSSIKSAIRIVPVRNTDFQHLRDGWVRGITSRVQEASRAGSKEYEDDAFGEAMKDFKAVFGGKGKAPWGSTVLLVRDSNGSMEVHYEEIKRSTEKGKEVVEMMQPELLGVVPDERISRQIWLGYLGGKNVSSEDARKSIVDGVVELVERPVGTVGMQVT